MISLRITGAGAASAAPAGDGGHSPNSSTAAVESARRAHKARTKTGRTRRFRIVPGGKASEGNPKTEDRKPKEVRRAKIRRPLGRNAASRKRSKHLSIRAARQFIRVFEIRVSFGFRTLEFGFLARVSSDNVHDSPLGRRRAFTWAVVGPPDGENRRASPRGSPERRPAGTG